MNDSDDPNKRSTKLPVHYEVGYAKPPIATRFQKGQSGNPRGRGKGSKSKTPIPGFIHERLKTFVLHEAYRLITINDAGGQISIPMAQAVVRSLAVSAAKGNQRAQRTFTELVAAIERDNKRNFDEGLRTAITYKVGWDRELERRKISGTTGPTPLPHPDDVNIDMNTGAVRFKGPMTKEEKVPWDIVRKEKREAEMMVERITSILETADIDQSIREHMEEQLKQSQKIVKMVQDAIGD